MTMVGGNHPKKHSFEKTLFERARQKTLCAFSPSLSSSPTEPNPLQTPGACSKRALGVWRGFFLSLIDAVQIDQAHELCIS